MMAMWNRKRNAPRDRHREFIYLDEVSVISLLAALEGEIKEAVTNTLSRTKEHTLAGTIGAPKVGASVESRFGVSRSSSSEVVRRAVIQSTFRDLWRRDVGVLLHDTSGTKSRLRKKIDSYQDLENALPKLKKTKMAVSLQDIHRGDIVEMDVKVEADQFFKLITMGTTILDLINGRESLFDISDSDVREVAPLIEVLGELLVGLVPMRGLATSHRVVEVAGEQVAVAADLLGADMLLEARPLELVGFAEFDSFWRDLRRTLFSGSTFTVYARAEGPILMSPWSPIKIADLLESLSPSLRDEVVLPLQQLDLSNAQLVETHEAHNIAYFQLANFATALQAAIDANPDAVLVEEAVVAAVPTLVSAKTIEERRRAFEPVTQAVAGDDVERDLVLTIRSKWMDQQPASLQNPSADPLRQLNAQVLPIQLEVVFVALYW